MRQTFRISKLQLADIAAACQDRNFSQEVDAIDEKGGHQKFLQCNHYLLVLQINLETGLLDSQLEQRKLVFGTNEKPVIQKAGYCQLLLSALQDFTLRILLVASILSIIIQVATATPQQRKLAWIQGVAIFIAVMICANVTAFNDYQKQKQFQSLNNVADSRKQVTVKRNGNMLNIHQDLVLVGDIVNLYEGMQIPADAYVLQASQLSCDESSMTGEPDPIKKNIFQYCKKKRDQKIELGEKNISGRHDIPSCVVMSGTRVLSGEGKILIIVVGDLSCLGKIRLILRQQDNTPTPLQLKLQKIATDIGKFGLISAIIILFTLLLRLAVQRIIENKWDHSTHWTQIVNYLILGITVVVVAIPEGLPLAVTLSLAYSVKKMLKDNNLVRKMQACQTMGGANMICSDKTGTLTMNKMTLNMIWNNTCEQLKETQVFELSKFPERFRQMFIISSCVNSSAELRPEPKGSSTQQAILKFMEKSGVKYQEVRAKNSLVKKFPFSSARKRMSVVVNYNGSDTLFLKGASELVLNSCSKWYNRETQREESIDSMIKQKMEGQIYKMAERALRTICIAYKPLQNPNYQICDSLGIFQVQKTDLIMLAILGIRDIPRPEVPDAIQKCKLAGIKVRMVTGDNKITAKAIAKQIGIITSEQSLVIDGPQFVSKVGGLVCKNCRTEQCDCPTDPVSAKHQNKQQRKDGNMEEFTKIIKNLDVMARSRPQDKYCLVTGLVELGEVVAVTGDGTNDAPALKKADVGFAMGIAGTQVARQASAIILLDDNFNSIVKAVLWGRNIYDAIRKFIQFQLTVNVVAVFITFIGAVSMKEQILTALQMLWVNLIMDTFASLALATEPPHEELLHHAPHKRTEYIISGLMFKHILGQSIYQLLIMIILTFAGEYFLPEYEDANFNNEMNLMKVRDKIISSYNCKSIINCPFSGDNSVPENVQIYFIKLLNNSAQLRYKNFNKTLGTVAPGRSRSFDGKYFQYYWIQKSLHIFSRHFTYIFNTFVMLQIFNFLNARKIRDQFNIFARILNNWLFILIVIGIFAGQIIIVTFGGIVFEVYEPYGLTVLQWLICVLVDNQIGFGMGGMIWSVLLKTLKIECIELGKDEANLNEQKTLSVLNLKRKPSEYLRQISLNHERQL